MIKKSILIILSIIFCSSLLTQVKKNVFEINGDALLFSIRGHVNWDYYKINKDKYEDTLFSYYHNNTKEIIIRNPYNETAKIDLPDSLYDNHLMIHKGFQAIKVDSINTSPFSIEGFKTTLSDFNGPRVIISIPDTISYNWNDLFLISQNSSMLNKIVTINPATLKNNEVQEKVRSLIVDYFNENRRVYNLQLNYHNLIPDSLNNKQFKIEINSRVDLSIVELEQNCFYVQGFTLDNENIPFFAIVFLNDNKVIIEPHSEVVNSFKILNDNYFYCKRSYPGTGLIVYSVLKFDMYELKSVFRDESYSIY